MKRSCNQQSRLKAFVSFHLPAVFFGCGIVVLSSIPNLSTSGLGFAISDKLAHFLEYGIFAALVSRSMTNLGDQHNSKRFLLNSAVCVTFFAVADELFLQRFVPGRSSDIYDLLFDLSGAYLVILLILIFIESRSEASR